MKTTRTASAPLTLSACGRPSPDNKWAFSIPADRLPAINVALRAAALSTSRQTPAEFDDDTAWEMAQTLPGRKLCAGRRMAQVLAQQVRVFGRLDYDAINAIVCA